MALLEEHVGSSFWNRNRITYSLFPDAKTEGYFRTNDCGIREMFRVNHWITVWCLILFYIVTHLHREIHDWTDLLLVVLNIAMVFLVICLLRCTILYSFKLYLNQLVFLYC